MIDKKAIKRYRIRRDGRLRKRGFRVDDVWDENKHPRGKDGRFTSGGGSSENRVKVDGPKATKSFISEYIKKNPKIKDEAKKYMGVLDKVKNFQKDNPNLEDGTYDAVTGKKKELGDGYCVTFHQNLEIGNEYGGYDDDDYAMMCAIAANELGADGPDIGYFGNAEISFNCKDIDKARNFAIEHNQHSVYDVAEDDIWINPYYDRKKNPIEGV